MVSPTAEAPSRVPFQGPPLVVDEPEPQVPLNESPPAESVNLQRPFSPLVCLHFRLALRPHTEPLSVPVNWPLKLPLILVPVWSSRTMPQAVFHLPVKPFSVASSAAASAARLSLSPLSALPPSSSFFLQPPSARPMKSTSATRRSRPQEVLIAMVATVSASGGLVN